MNRSEEYGGVPGVATRDETQINPTILIMAQFAQISIFIVRVWELPYMIFHVATELLGPDL